MGLVILIGLPALLLPFGLRPSPFGWGVLAVAGAACLALATRDALLVRQWRGLVARV